MDIQSFKSTLADDTPPSGLDIPLKALWHEARGDWHTAHDLLQDDAGRAGSWVHAYLHRKEGDLGNAAYWYRRADKPVFRQSLEAEWDQIVEALLNP